MIEIDMQMVKKIFGVIFNPVMHGDESDQQQQDEYAFERFKACNGAQASIAGTSIDGLRNAMSGWVN